MTAVCAGRGGGAEDGGGRRRLITFASMLSLLLCVATTGLWVRGMCGRGKPAYRVVFTSFDRRLWELTCRQGEIVVNTLHRWPNSERVTFFSAPASEFVGAYAPWE